MLETITYDYNLQNRLERVETDYQNGTIEIAEYKYNPDGVRMSKLIWAEVGGNPQGDVCTDYLIDSYNHTGYAQTLEESIDVTYEEGSPVSISHFTTYLIGDDVIAQTKDGLRITCSMMVMARPGNWLIVQRRLLTHSPMMLMA
ncbi:MAG: hypothetical protein ACYS0I_04630 [Planctomycetota bacterium]